MNEIQKFCNDAGIRYCEVTGREHIAMIPNHTAIKCGTEYMYKSNWGILDDPILVEYPEYSEVWGKSGLSFFEWLQSRAENIRRAAKTKERIKKIMNIKEICETAGLELHTLKELPADASAYPAYSLIQFENIVLYQGEPGVEPFRFHTVEAVGNWVIENASALFAIATVYKEDQAAAAAVASVVDETPIVQAEVPAQAMAQAMVQSVLGEEPAAELEDKSMEDRHLYIGGSEIPAIMGTDDFKNKLDILEVKAGLKEPEQLEDLKMLANMGNDWEHIIAAKVNAGTGANYQEQSIIVEPYTDAKVGVRLNMDGVDVTNAVPLIEIKTTATEVPKAKQIDQIQAYLGYNGWSQAYLVIAVRIPGSENLGLEPTMENFPLAFSSLTTELITFDPIRFKDIQDTVRTCQADIAALKKTGSTLDLIKFTPHKMKSLRNNLRKAEDLEVKIETLKADLREKMTAYGYKKIDVPDIGITATLSKTAVIKTVDWESVTAEQRAEFGTEVVYDEFNLEDFKSKYPALAEEFTTYTTVMEYDGTAFITKNLNSLAITETQKSKPAFKLKTYDTEEEKAKAAAKLAEKAAKNDSPE